MLGAHRILSHNGSPFLVTIVREQSVSYRVKIYENQFIKVNNDKWPNKKQSKTPVTEISRVSLILSSGKNIPLPIKKMNTGE